MAISERRPAGDRRLWALVLDRVFGVGVGGALPFEVAVSVALSILSPIVWASTGNGYFWPRWIWFGLFTVLALQMAALTAMRMPPGRDRRLAVHVAAFSILSSVELLVWALSGGGFFWPIFPLVVLVIALGTHLWFYLRPVTGRERELSHRIDVLSRTRSGALDSQAAELRRIERDLHDGAQARMVSLGMSLGLAEHLLRSDPDAAAALVAEARASTLSALDELRSVMQTIHPPVLADRGLSGAIEALALDLSVPITVRSSLESNAPPPVESAMYFAVAECLANIIKHSRATAAAVSIDYRDGAVRAVVTDDGVGGAEAAGGTGLTGIARRLEAFDGTMSLSSPAGGPTSISMEVPCALSSPKTSPSSATG